MVAESALADNAGSRIDGCVYETIFFDGATFCQYYRRTYYNIEHLKFDIYIWQYLDWTINRCICDIYVFS